MRLDQSNLERYHTRDIAIWGVLLLALLLYFTIGLSDLRLPGLEYDEAADAVPAMELIMGRPVTSLSTITLFGRQLPLMMLHHIGPTTIYTSFIGMSLFGISVESLRLSQLIVGAVALVLLWIMARSWFGKGTAVIAVLLCATAPAFIWWNRAGANWTAPLLPLALGTLLLLRRWWHTRQPLALVVAAFLFGIGFVTKILFIWLVAPIALTALLTLGFTGIWRVLRSVQLMTCVAAAMALVIGLAPFIIHNVVSPWATFKFLAANAVTTQIYGHNNLDVLNNLRVVVVQFVAMMGGDTLAFDAPSGLPLGSAALVAGIIYSALLCIRHRARIPYRPRISGDSRGTEVAVPGLRLRLFLVICLSTVVPLSTISTSSIGATYLFILAPLAWLLIAIAMRDGMVWLGQQLTARRARLVAVAAVTAIGLNHIGTNIAIHRNLLVTGGHGFWSDSIFTLAEELQSQFPQRPIKAMDWGFERSVAFLTRDAVQMQEVFEYLPEPSPKFADMSTVLLRDPANVYVFHTPDTTAFRGHWDVFERAASKSHKTVQLVETLYERGGISNTLIYIAQATPRSFTVAPGMQNRNATLSGGLVLLGGNATYEADRHEISLQLFWQSNADHQSDDTVLVHVVDQSNGEAVVVADQQPVYGSYPYSRWQRGEVVTDPHWITLPSNLKPGVYQVRVGVYDRNTGVRRAISDPQNDAAGNSLMLHSFAM